MRDDEIEHLGTVRKEDQEIRTSKRKVRRFYLTHTAYTLDQGS